MVLGLLILSTPVNGIGPQMFDLGNFTVDTGLYGPPPDANADHLPGTYPSVGWNWDTGAGAIFANTPGAMHGYTSISIIPIPSEIAVETFLVATLITLIEAEEEHETGRYEDYINNSAEMALLDKHSIHVTQPYTGWIATAPRAPNAKVYVGVIDQSNCLVVISTESDEMFSFLLSGLRVIPKEQAPLARLEKIRKSVG